MLHRFINNCCRILLINRSVRSHFINTPEDVANFCPNIPELHEAIAQWTGLDIEQIRDAIENLGVEDVSVEDIKEDSKEVAIDGFDAGQADDVLADFEEICAGDIDDLPFNLYPLMNNG